MVDETDLVSFCQVSDSNYHIDSTKSMTVRCPSFRQFQEMWKRPKKAMTVAHDLLQVVKSLFQGCMMPRASFIAQHFQQIEASGERELSVALLKSLFLTSRASCMRCRKLLIFVDIVGTSWSYFPGIWSKGREWFLMFSLVALLDS